MTPEELEYWSVRAAAWARSYQEDLRARPVRSQSAPGATLSALPDAPPEQAEPMERIFEDFAQLVPDGMTHWQHPRFFAYFPANAAPASQLAEQLANAISAQCMLWQTSPAATEMEIRMISWLAQALGLPTGLKGVIQDSATSATLSAVLTMRERALGWSGLEDGLSGQPRLRIYASAQTHSSVEKAVRLSGIGARNLVQIPVRADLSMDPSALQRAIAEDLANGHKPAGLVLCSGGTSVGAFDDIGALMSIAKAHDLYTHVDAAWAGSAMICPEFRTHWTGVEAADSIVFNPHKWLGASFDCSVQFLKDPSDQIRTLAIRPAYLETAGQEDITDFSEWTIPLGRRFRALKLWFLMRAYGLGGLRTRIRNHVAWTGEAEERIAALPGFEIVTKSRLALFTFRYAPQGRDPDEATARLLERINDDGRIYLTQTLHNGAYVIRITVGQFDCTREDVMAVPEVLAELTS